MDQERWYVRNEQGDFYAGFGRWVSIFDLWIAETFEHVTDARSFARYLNRQSALKGRYHRFEAVKL